MRPVQYVSSAEGIDPDQLDGPFFVGWPDPPPPETHLEILRKSDYAVLAFDKQDQVVGFVTAISDQVLAAYIPLLEVVPDRQGEGIGTELVRRLLEEIGDLYMVDAVTDAAVLPFYERLGFHGAAGVARRNYSQQAGRR